MKSPTGLNPTQGLIFNTQRFSIHDGPGIRTTVFMKGCPLTCDWCSNPESQDPFPTLMARDIACTGCGGCVDACPQGAISLHDTVRRIDWDRCDRCLQCAAACLYDSLKVCGERVTVDHLLRQVLKDSAFYRNSGGGVTVSGGEPLMQADFVAVFLEQCKEAGLHTALDTTGYTAWSAMSSVLHFVDLVLFDVKHLDSAVHEHTTGVPNETILENLSKTVAVTPVWLRVPLIEGFNDADEHIRAVALLGRELGVEKISLLPYHEGGRNKCEQIGRSYRCATATTPGDRCVERAKNIIEAEWVRVSVGF